MGEIVLSINGESVAKAPNDGQQRSMHASVGDYQVKVFVGDDILVDISHRSLVPCSICGHKMMEVKPGHWACPGFYGSPMHFCDPAIFSHHDPAKREEGLALARQRLEEYCGCTLEEYLEAGNRIAESGNDASYPD